MFIEGRSLPASNLNRIPFKFLPNAHPSWQNFAVELTGRLMRSQVLWRIAVKESATSFLKFVCGLWNCSVWLWLIKVKEGRTGCSSIWKELWQSVSVPQGKEAERVWHLQESSNLLQSQTTISNRRANDIPSNEYLQHNRRTVLMETSKNSLYQLSIHKSRACNNQEIISVFYYIVICKIS